MPTPSPTTLPSLLEPEATPTSAAAQAARRRRRSRRAARKRRMRAMALTGLAALSLLAVWTYWPGGHSAVPLATQEHAEQIARDLRALDHQPDEQAQAAFLIQEARRAQLPGAPLPQSVRPGAAPIAAVPPQ